MKIDKNTKLGLGSLLGVIGAIGIILGPLMGWSQIASPWDFLLGFLFGVSAGLGTALVVGGLLEKRC
jgi:predicted ABC-type sugar transport system permease subunit